MKTVEKLNPRRHESAIFAIRDCRSGNVESLKMRFTFGDNSIVRRPIVSSRYGVRVSVPRGARARGPRGANSTKRGPAISNGGVDNFEK